MKRVVLIAVVGCLMGMTADAGVFRVVVFPVRHPVKTTKTVFRLATYPVRHPVKAAY